MMHLRIVNEHGDTVPLWAGPMAHRVHIEQPSLLMRPTGYALCSIRLPKLTRSRPAATAEEARFCEKCRQRAIREGMREEVA